MTRRLTLDEIESRVCDIAVDVTGVPRADVHPHLRVIQDLHCDSLDFVDLIMRVEGAFGVSLPRRAPSATFKVVFTRDPFRLSDLAELVYLQQDSPRAERSTGWRRSAPVEQRRHVPFTQLGGRMDRDAYAYGPLLEATGSNLHGLPTFRRRTDGMTCVAVPGADVVLGSDDNDGPSDERPRRRVRLDGFLIDQEPVSTTAYCRFLNSAGPVDATLLQEWFVLAPDDHRHEHVLLRHADDRWTPLAGTERMPMMLVSWFGANAYALWANRRDWRGYRSDGNGADDGAFLPSEAQWEYAARGPEPRAYPWGDDAPSPALLRCAQHQPGETYRPDALPMADVNAELGMSPFGLHHMAGNVWQWCRDWFAPDFYAAPEAAAANPVNRRPSNIRSERGGSWIGPGFLCRSSYRRGRVPTARGRCLGFRCAANPPGMRKSL